MLSFIGSYTGLRAGDTYPTLVRKTEPRPIRVFLQDGSRDLDIYSGNWWLGNQAMAMDTLYVTVGDALFRRRLRRKGVFPGQVVKLPTPRL